MSQDQSKLRHSIEHYQQAAEDLEEELVKAFYKLSKKTGHNFWKPLNSLRSKNDVPKLDDVVKEIRENVEKLRDFDHEEKSQRLWDQVKRGINKFVKCTFPALTSFMILTKDVQTIPILNPYGVVCDTILLLISVAEIDAKRKENFPEELKEIGTCLDFLEDAKSLPDEFFSTDEIQSKAFDLMTATLELMLHQVKYLTTFLGGRVMEQLITKNQNEYESAREALKTAVREYDRALDQGHRKMNAENLSISKKTHAVLMEQAITISRMSESMESKIDLPSVEAAAFDSRSEESEGKCHLDTRKVLLYQIMEWAQDPQGKCIFWLNGMAGTGKSTIARTVAQSFSVDGKLGASFFFKRSERDRSNASKFFTTIAFQLAYKITEIKSYVRSAIIAEPEISGKSLTKQFDMLIFQPLMQVIQTSKQKRTLIMVIDALDECDGEDDIREILHLLLKTRNLESVSMRIFLTSRPELPIRLKFREMSADAFNDVALQDIPQVEHDISIYINDELVRIKKEYDIRYPHSQLPPDWPGDGNIKALAAMASPLFIFAATICRFVGDRKRNWDPSERLATILKDQKISLISKLDQTYLTVLKQLVVECTNDLEKETLTKEFGEIIGSIMILADPLPAYSLASLLGISEKHVDNLLDYLHSVLSIPSDRDSPVRLLHLSFRDFLLDPKKQGKNEFWFWIDERKLHEIIVIKCLELMSGINRLRENMCGLDFPGKLRNTIDPEILHDRLSPDVRYACQYWVHHLDYGKIHIYDNDAVYGFLKKHFLHWLEALSLMGKLSESIAMIDTLQSLIDAIEGTEMSRFLYDAKRFVLQYRWIIDTAPLQLYSSAIIFAPETSIIRNMFKDRIPRWVYRLPKVPSVWSPVLQTLEGHTGPVNAVAFSRDGQVLASASDDRTVKLWNPATGERKQKLEGHTGSVNAVAFSYDDQLLASVSDDGSVRLWNPATGEHKQTLEGHTNSVSAVAFSRDSGLLASTSDDGTVMLWNSATGEKQTFEGHSGSVRAVAFSRDGQLLASGSGDRTIRLWNPANGEHKQTLEGHTGSVSAVAFSRDGQLLASASGDRTVRLWNPTTGEQKQTLEGHTDWVRAVAFSRDSQLLASASGDGTVRLWNSATGEQKQTLEGRSGSVRAVAFSRDGQLLASASDNGTVKLWNPATGEQKQTLEGHTGWISALAFSRDGHLLASASGDGTIRLWNPATGERETLDYHTDWVKAVAFSRDGQLLASTSGDGTVKLWNPATGEQKQTLKGHPGWVSAMEFSPDGQLLASASGDGMINLWNPETGEQKQTLEGHTSWVRAVVFSCDSQLLASASVDHTVKLWNSATGDQKHTLEGHTGSVWAVAFSCDGRLLASASDDGTVRIWNPMTGEHKQTLEGHTGWVRAVAFSRDGQLLASASGDRTVRLWNPTTGERKQTLEGHTGSVRAVTFSRDGQLLASASIDRTVRLWNPATGEKKYEINLDIIVSKICFSNDHQCLETDRGILCLPSDLCSVLLPEPKSPDSIFFNDHWITRNGQNILWFPHENRGCSALKDNVLVIGQHSGLVNFMEFTFK